ncbi:MAG: hypothetical protein AAB500_01775 [Patescibacteria group bacterium]
MSAPSVAVMGTAEACLERSAPILGATAAADYCLKNRAMEVGRDTSTARAAADAETNKPVVVANPYGSYGMYGRRGCTYDWQCGGGYISSWGVISPSRERTHMYNDPRYNSLRRDGARDTTARAPYVRPRRP